MPDLNVIAVIVAKEGSETLVREALQSLVEPTLQEEGCLAYALNESAATPGTFLTYETWRAQADLDAHLETPHVQQALTTAFDALAAPPAIHPLLPVE